MSLNLSKAEIKEVTNKTRLKNQVSALFKMGIPFKVRPDGSILVCRVAYIAAMGYEQNNVTETLPDFSAIQ